MATKTSSNSRGKSAAATRKRNAAQQRARRQIHAIILFAVGIFVAALTLVKGSSGWNWLHNAMFGLFGWGAIFVAVTLLYIAALLTMDKPFKARALNVACWSSSSAARCRSSRWACPRATTC